VGQGNFVLIGDDTFWPTEVGHRSLTRTTDGQMTPLPCKRITKTTPIGFDRDHFLCFRMSSE
jgi:hypothetical protein